MLSTLLFTLVGFICSTSVTLLRRWSLLLIRNYAVLLMPPLTSASSAAQCRFWLHVGCCVLLREVSFWSLVPVWLLCSEGPFRLWVHQHGMISPLSCVPC